MDNIPEREQTKEPRRGIPPFAGGIEELGEERYDPSYNTSITFKEFSLGDVGKFNMYLMRPSKGNIRAYANEDEQGYTIDLSGTIQTGNLRDFYKAGYYNAFLFEKEFPEQEISNDQLPQRLGVNLWIDNTETTISGSSDQEIPRTIGFTRGFEKHVLEQFVLPNDPALLQAIRISVNSRQENPNNPNSG